MGLRSGSSPGLRPGPGPGPGRGLRRPDRAALDPAALVELRAALAAGAAPGTALTAAGHGPLEPVARAVRLGRPLSDVAAEVATGDARTDLLVRALALAEATGSGALAAVDQTARAAEEDAELTRLLDTHTVQARGTIALLAGMPVVLWLVLIALNPASLRFYTRPVGVATGLAALALGAAAQVWSRRIVDRARRASAAADPLTPPRPRPDLVRGAAFAAPMLVAMSVTAGLGVGLGSAAVAGMVGLRPRRAATQAGAAPQLGEATADQDTAAAGATGGAAETVELVAVALDAGLPAVGALAAVAPLAPAPARRPLDDAARRLRGGWSVDEAFAGSPLAALGEVLAATHRWGAPAAPALRHLAAELRADRRSAVAAAAERTQLHLIFPTTMLMLPAFALAVVTPLVWTAFAGGGGFGANP